VLGVRQDNPKGQGTAVTKTYQMNEVAATELAVPEQVILSMAEIAEDMREGLLALAVGAGLQVIAR
jgi:putative transposase